MTNDLNIDYEKEMYIIKASYICKLGDEVVGHVPSRVFAAYRIL